MAEMFKVNAPVRKPLFEGVQGENEARSIVFDITPWVDELGDGAVTATAKRSQDSQPYPVTVTKDGNIVTWKPTSTDTAYAGVGSFQLEYTVDDVLAKTCIWSTMVAPSLDPAGDPPDPYDNWLAEMRQIAADALQSEQNAEDSAEDAEAWAVGQRGGVDVPSTDPTYENNAKYWAGQAEELKDETQAIVDEARADVFEAMDGLHEETTAGSALQLISDKYTENKEPYLFRKSIAGDRELDTLVGGSVAFNQLVRQNAFSTGTNNGITFTNNGDGSIAVSGTATDSANKTVGVSRVINHVYFLMGCPNGGSASTFSLGITQSTTIRDFGNGCIWKATSNNNTSLAIFVANGVTMQNVVFKPQLFDLTQMFGTAVADRLYAMEQATAGAGVAWFKERFPKDYYAYNAGELMSVKTTAHEMVGFNQWDEEWEVGGINSSGQLVGGASIRSKNYIPVKENSTYFFKTPKRIKAHAYDINKNWIGGIDSALNDLRTTPQGCAYILFYVTDSTYGATYNNDICISFSSARNGEYEPYTKHTYALDDVELRGVPKLVDGEIQYDGDTYEADGTVTRRFGIVDLGTLNWAAGSTNTSGIVRMASTINGAKPSADASTVANIFCTKYEAKSNNATYTKSTGICIAQTGNGSVYVYDENYNTSDKVSAFASAVSGVYLIYEKATPTTETASPFTSPQIVDAYGTERYVDERTVAVPVGHVTKYPDNLREKLDGLPWDFSSLIAPTEKAYTATRNYTTGALLIVNNTLYKVTANIANGGAITPNTNVVATTLSEVISAL